MRIWYRALPLLAVLCLCLPVSACRNQNALERNRALWQSHDIHSYTYRLKITCFCPIDLTTPVYIQVENGAPLNLSYDGGGAANEEIFARYSTMERLFDFIADAYNQNAAAVKVTYHNVYGFPSQISIDYLQNALDDEIALDISGFFTR